MDGSRCREIEGVVAIDGKTVRRSRDDAKGNRPAHVVSAWACEASLVLGQLKVDEKTNEIKAIPELLDILCLKGCVVTIDAMGTQKEIAEKIIDKEADYILQVKGNQERIMEDIALYFEKDVFPCRKNELAEEGRYYKDICFDHGRQETREYYVENEIGWLKADHPEWKGLSGIGACVSTVTEKGVATQSISYSIYSRSGMGAEEYGKCKRAHWGIENSLHWVLDIGFREDESRIRAGNAAENVNVLRHIGTNLLKQEKAVRWELQAKGRNAGMTQIIFIKCLEG